MPRFDFTGFKWDTQTERGQIAYKVLRPLSNEMWEVGFKTSTIRSTTKMMESDIMGEFLRIKNLSPSEQMVLNSESVSRLSLYHLIQNGVSFYFIATENQNDEHPFQLETGILTRDNVEILKTPTGFTVLYFDSGIENSRSLKSVFTIDKWGNNKRLIGERAHNVYEIQSAIYMTIV